MDGIAKFGSTGATYNRGGDLIPSQLPELDGLTSCRNIAETLYRWIESSTIATLEWYMSEKKSKASWSRSLRVLAVIFATAGGVLPLISVGTNQTRYAFWGYPLLAAAAGCVAIDRAFGFSSSWMRYLTAATALQKLLLRHQLRWAEMRMDYGNADISAAQFKDALDELRDFADSVADVVVGETQNWVNEFRGHFSQLEAQASKL